LIFNCCHSTVIVFASIDIVVVVVVVPVAVAVAVPAIVTAV